MSFRSFQILFFVFFLNVINFKAQEVYNKDFSYIGPEKIYLNLDKEIYNKRSTIWFSASIVNSFTHFPTDLSKILRVFLVDKKNKVLQKKMISIKDGIAEGFFDIIDYEEGTYYLVAQTIWNENFGNIFLSKKEIIVFDINTNKKSEIFKNTVVTYQENGNKILKIELHPKKLDSLHKGNLLAIVNLDTIKKRINTKQSKLNKDKFLLELPLEKEFGKVIVEIITKNQRRMSKRILLNNDIDVQFFPESGKLIDSFSSKIAFKAINSLGRGEKIKGEIFEETTKLLDFESNDLGMGTFIINNPTFNKNYYAEIIDSVSEIKKVFKLPRINKLGTTLTVIQHKDSIDVLVKTNTNQKSFYLSYSTRGVILSGQKINLKNNENTLKISKDNFLDGITKISLLDGDKNKILDRLIFIENNKQRIKIISAKNKEVYKKRELTKVKIRPLVGYENENFFATARVVLKDEALNYKSSNNILSYLLLDSDLKGKIEKPGFYLNENKEKDIDALLLSQGWTNYNFDNYTRKYEPEQNIEVTGLVRSKLKKQKNKETELLLYPLNNKERPKIFFTNSKVPGNFKFNLGEIYGENLNVYIQKVKKDEKNQLDYVINKPKKITIPNLKSNNIDFLKPFQNRIIEKSKERKVKQEEFLFLKKGTVVLDEVTIKSKLNIPKRDKIIEEYGEPDYEIPGKEIVAKKKSWTTGMLQILQFNFFDKVTVTRNPNTYRLEVKALGGFKEQNFIMIDGIFVIEDELYLVESISSEEVIHFEVIEDLSIKSYRKAFIATYGEPPQFGPFDGNLISIYTKSGKGIHGALKTRKKTNVFNVPVLSKSREYYTPKYDYELTEEEKAILDNRTLLYWNPKLQLNTNKFTELNFYNSDVTGDFILILEILSSKGRLGYNTLEFKVEKD